MKHCILILASLAVALSACSAKDTDREPASLKPAASVPLPASPQAALPERPTIDLGDVDSGVLLIGLLEPSAASDTVTADYVQTQRNRLSMATITVKPPHPEQLPLRFEIASTRAFAERPVVLRIRVYRDEVAIGEEAAFVLGKDAAVVATDPSGNPLPRMLQVNALEGLESAPETMLIHARADAWLMETGAPEDLIDPRTATSPDRVSLLSNPVRINFVSEEKQS